MNIVLWIVGVLAGLVVLFYLVYGIVARITERQFRGKWAAMSEDERRQYQYDVYKQHIANGSPF